MTASIKALSDGLSGELQVGGNPSLRFGADTSGQLAPFRNRIINGDMRIDQRNNGAAQTLSQAYAYTVDRWFTYSFGANSTGQRVASGVTGVPYVYQITGNTGITAIQFMQRIESSNIADLAGSTVTFSALLSNSLLTSITWTAYYPNSVDNYATYTQIATGTFTVNSTLTKYSTQISLPANAANGLWIIFTANNQTSGTWKIGNVQLEAGSIATPFEQRPIGTELALCQRYYELVDVIGTQAGTNTGQGNAVFKVSKRTVPTLSNQANGLRWVRTSAFDITSTAAISATGNVSVSGAYILQTVTGATAGVVTTVPVTGFGIIADAEL